MLDFIVPLSVGCNCNIHYRALKIAAKDICKVRVMDSISGRLLLKEEKITGFSPLPGLEEKRPLVRRAALIEISGRDSIAAGLLAARSGRFEVMVPTIVYTGSEYGDWKAELDNSRALAAHLRDFHGIDAPDVPVVLGSPRWFHAVSGRFLSELYSIYGFPGICVACHMYCHTVRIPLARELGAFTVVSGERLEHDGRMKINQLDVTLDAYAEVLAEAGIKLESPLMETSLGSEVEDIISGVPGINANTTCQTRCVLEANYRDPKGRMSYREDRLGAYLREFLVPVTRKILEQISAGVDNMDYVEIARKIISERKYIEGTVGNS